MKAQFRYNHWLPKLIKVEAITLYPFVLFSRDKQSALLRRTIAHECVHVAQIRKVGVIKFYVTYLYEYLRNLAKCRDHNLAYFAISYEQEAFAKQDKFPILPEAK